MNASNITTGYLSQQPKPPLNNYKNERTIYCVLLVILIKLVFMLIFKKQLITFYKKKPISIMLKKDKNENNETCLVETNIQD